jgi:hypothetical protein
MGSGSPGPLKPEGRFFKRFMVARSQRYLYDFERASKRDPRHESIAIARAITLVALIGGAIWFLLWKVFSHFMAIP